MSEIKNMNVALEKARSPKEVMAMDFVADRTIKNYEAVTGRKDGNNWYNSEMLAMLQIFAEKPDYAKADKMSIWGCLQTAARTGLSIADGHLDLIMYGTILKAEPNYRGMREQLWKMDEIKFISEAQVVFKGDAFVYDKLNQKITKHESGAPPKAMTLDMIEAAYVRIEFKDGRIVDVVVWHPELAFAKSKSKNKTEWGPWNTTPSEMCKKTAIKRAKKIYFRPTHPEIADAEMSKIEEQEETMDTQHEEVPPTELSTKEPELPITPTEEVKEQPKKEKASRKPNNMSALLEGDE